MRWLHTTVAYNMAVEAGIVTRFRAIIARLGERQDAAVFVADADDRRSTGVFLTPDAAEWAGELLPAAAWSTSLAPVRDLRTSLLIGNRCNLDLLGSPARRGGYGAESARGSYQAGFSAFPAD